MNIEHVHPVGKDLDRVGAGEHTPIERAAPGLINREIQPSRIGNGFDTNRWQGQWFRSPPQKSVDQWTGLSAWPGHHDSRALEVLLRAVPAMPLQVQGSGAGSLPDLGLQARRNLSGVSSFFPRRESLVGERDAIARGIGEHRDQAVSIA
jgi:hypothetical protein